MFQQFPAKSTSGRIITEKGARGKLSLSIFASTLGTVWMAVAWGMPLIMFMDFLGASGVIIGSIGTIRQFIFCVQVPGSLLIESRSSRKSVFFPVFLTDRLLWFVPAALPFIFPDDYQTAAWVMLGIIAVTTTSGQIGSAAWFSWMADLIPTKLSNRFWGRREAMTFMGFLISTIAAGRILDYFPGEIAGTSSAKGFAIVFISVAVFGVTDILLYFFVPEPTPARPHSDKPVLERIIAPLRKRNFLYLTLAFGCWLFSLGLTGSFMPVYLKRDFGVSYTDLSLLVIFSCLGMILGSQIWAQIIERIGSRAFGAAIIILSQVPAVLWFFITPGDYSLAQALSWLPTSWVSDQTLATLAEYTLPAPICILLPSVFFSGAFISGFNICRNSLSTLLAPRNGRTIAMAMHWTVAGLLSCASPILGGYIMDWIVANPVGLSLPGGVPFSFFHILLVLQAIATVVAAMFMTFIRTGSDKLPLGVAIRRMLVGNPLQAVRNISAMNSPVARMEKARAAYKLGQSKTALATSDLIALLEDESLDVQEAAAHALGNIGSSDALEALIGKLADPHSDLSPQVARALRHCPSPRSVPALIDRLRDGDRETRTECVRALGAIGDRRATEALLAVLEDDEDGKVVSVAADALAKLGEIRAATIIVTRLKDASNPVRKRALAGALADLLGQPEEFYKILSRERDEPGSEFDRLARGLGKSLNPYSRISDTLPLYLAVQEEIERLTPAFSAGDYARCLQALADVAAGIHAVATATPRTEDLLRLAGRLSATDPVSGTAIVCLLHLRDRRASSGNSEPEPTEALLAAYILHRHTCALLRPL